MRDRGANAVDPEPSSLATVLTPRLAARFERALVLDERGEARAANRERIDRLGPGLFELAMTSRHAAVPSAEVDAGAADPASLRALAAAARAFGRELLGADGARVVVPPSDAEGEARLARARGLPMAAILDEAIAATTEVALHAGDDAALAWFVATAARIDPRVSSVALGVIAGVAARTDEMVGTFSDRVAHARAALATRRRAIERAAEMRATRDEAIATEAEAARAQTSAAIEYELVASLRVIEETRTRDLAAVDRWHGHELPLGVAGATMGREATVAAAATLRQAALDAAQTERLSAIGESHEIAMAAIDRAHATYDAAVADRLHAVERLRERQEREAAAIDRIEDPETRARIGARSASQLAAELSTAEARANAIEIDARAQRDRAIALADTGEADGRARLDEHYRARVAEIERTYERTVRAAEDTLGETADVLGRAAAARRAAIDATAVAATRAAHDRAIARRANDIEAAADAALRARESEIDTELTALDELVGGDPGGERDA